MTKKVKTNNAKPTQAEHEVYLSYVKNMEAHKVPPRPEAEWVKSYREIQSHLQPKVGS